MTRELTSIEARVAAATGDHWEFGSTRDRTAAVSVRFTDGREELLRVTREAAAADVGDVRFIANARQDLERLVAGLRGQLDLTREELDEIEERCAGTSPGPWKVFLEEEGGIGGSNVIWVSDNEDEPDLYLWLGAELAPAADFEFVAAARQDIPELLWAVRRGCGSRQASE